MWSSSKISNEFLHTGRDGIEGIPPGTFMAAFELWATQLDQVRVHSDEFARVYGRLLPSSWFPERGYSPVRNTQEVNFPTPVCYARFGWTGWQALLAIPFILQPLGVPQSGSGGSFVLTSRGVRCLGRQSDWCTAHQQNTCPLWPMGLQGVIPILRQYPWV